MSETATPRAIAGLWTALRKPDFEASGRGVEMIYRKAAATGWVDRPGIESLVYATDPRLLSNGALTIRELLAAFGTQLQWIYRRPRHGEEGGLGAEAVSSVDLARLLIELEATGFAVDPAPLCAMLRPHLRTKENLVLAEIAVWWHAKERHRSAPRILATGPVSTWGRRDDELTTPSGYRAELFRSTDGGPTALVVMAPKHRPNRRSVAA